MLWTDQYPLLSGPSYSLCATAHRRLNLFFACLFDADERVDQLQWHQSHQSPAALCVERSDIDTQTPTAAHTFRVRAALWSWEELICSFRQKRNLFWRRWACLWHLWEHPSVSVESMHRRVFMVFNRQRLFFIGVIVTLSFPSSISVPSISLWFSRLCLTTYMQKIVNTLRLERSWSFLQGATDVLSLFSFMSNIATYGNCPV